jgi:(1->4)-alpha-D-glucan 1-alpha-D-glucosylmutase
MPGLPDIYRGTEGAALDLTDPDNRRPIDLHHLSTLPAQSGFDGQKSRLLTQLLAARKAAPSLFLSGDFEIDASAKGITLRRNSTDGASLQLTLNPELPCENAVTLHFHMPD